MKKKNQIKLINIFAFANSICLLALAIPLAYFLSQGLTNEDTIIIVLGIPEGMLSITSIVIGFFQIFTFSQSHIPFLQLWAGWLNVFFILMFLSVICSLILMITIRNADEHYEMVEKYQKFERKENIYKQERWNEELRKMDMEKELNKPAPAPSNNSNDPNVKKETSDNNSTTNKTSSETENKENKENKETKDNETNNDK